MGVLGHVRETHRLNIVSSRGKAGLKRLQRGVRWVWDMVAEIIGEEIQAILAVDRVHSGEVGGVDTISKQLHAHAWNHERATFQDGSSS